MQNLYIRESSAEASVPCAPLSMLDWPGRTSWDGVRFPVHRGSNGRDDSMAGLCDCIKECVL